MSMLAVLLLLVSEALPLGPFEALPLPAPRNLAVPFELAARLPADGIRVATLPDHHPKYGPQSLLVVAIARDGIHVLGQMPVDADSVAFKWLDGHTLFLATNDFKDRIVHITRIVDGVGAEIVAIPPDAWQLAADEEAPVTIELLLSGSPTQRWIGGCVKPLVDEPGCKTQRYLRVDASPFVVSRKAPRPRPADRDRGLAALPTARPPAGVSVVLTHRNGVRGLSCKSPLGACEWPDDYGDFQTQPKKLRWVHDKPPIFVVEGPHVWPMGERTTVREAFVACEPEPMRDFRWLGAGVWARAPATTDGEQSIMQPYWRFYLDNVPVAEVPGDTRLQFALAPR